MKKPRPFPAQRELAGFRGLVRSVTETTTSVPGVESMMVRISTYIYAAVPWMTDVKYHTDRALVSIHVGTKKPGERKPLLDLLPQIKIPTTAGLHLINRKVALDGSKWVYMQLEFNVTHTSLPEPKADYASHGAMDHTQFNAWVRARAQVLTKEHKHTLDTVAAALGSGFQMLAGRPENIKYDPLHIP